MFGSIGNAEITDDNGSTRTPIDIKRSGDTVKRYVKYNERINVANSKGEVAEYINFSTNLIRLRNAGLLFVWDKDPDTTPTFKVEYGKHNDGLNYFIVKSWAERTLE